MSFLVLIFALVLGFWLILAGLSGPSIAVGVVISLLVLWLNHDLLLSLAGRVKIVHLAKLMLMIFYLLGQIFLANLQVAKIVLQRDMPLQLGVVSFNPGLKTDLFKGLLANAITLTPGTLTVDVEGDIFTVHALTIAAAQSVVSWRLISWLSKMEAEYD